MEQDRSQRILTLDDEGDRRIYHKGTTQGERDEVADHDEKLEADEFKL